MTSLEVDRLSAKLIPLLERLAAETGLSITMGKITYTEHNAVFAVEAAVRGESGITMGREAEAFLVNAGRFGLEATDLGRDFEHLGVWYRIVGMRPRSTRTPVICRCIAPPTKALMLFPAHVVRHYMEQRDARTRPSPHARIRIEIGDEPSDEPPGELPALPS